MCSCLFFIYIQNRKDNLGAPSIAMRYSSHANTMNNINNDVCVGMLQHGMNESIIHVEYTNVNIVRLLGSAHKRENNNAFHTPPNIGSLRTPYFMSMLM